MPENKQLRIMFYEREEAALKKKKKKKREVGRRKTTTMDCFLHPSKVAYYK